MPRVKRGTLHVKKRNSLLKKTKGFKWGRKNLIKQASTAAVKAGVHSYIDRKKKKRNTRALWQIKISAFVRQHGLSYSRFINLLKVANIELDRKILADFSENNKELFLALIEKVKI